MFLLQLSWRREAKGSRIQGAKDSPMAIILDFVFELFYYATQIIIPTKGQSCRKAVTQSHGSKASKAMIAGLPKVQANAFMQLVTRRFLFSDIHWRPLQKNLFARFRLNVRNP